MMRLSKMVETDHNGMPIGYSIAVVNDIDVMKSEYGDYYFFSDKEKVRKYNTVYNKDWEYGYIEIHFMSNNDYWNEKIKLDKQMDEIQKRIDKLEICHRTVHIDENERNGYTPKNGIYHMDERCWNCKHCFSTREIMGGLESEMEFFMCKKQGSKLVNPDFRCREYESKEEEERKIIQSLKQN